MKPLPPEKRAQLSRLILDARTSARRDWSRDRLADKAELELRRHAHENQDSYERSDLLVFLKVDISSKHIEAFENCPAHPLCNPERRARLLGICLALGLDFGQINRLSGGIG